MKLLKAFGIAVGIFLIIASALYGFFCSTSWIYYSYGLGASVVYVGAVLLFLELLYFVYYKLLK